MSDLRERLKKAGIEPSELAELIWPFLRGKFDLTKRDRLLAAAVAGIAVNWKEPPAGKESAQRAAEMAERLVDAVMSQEERRTGI